MAKDIFGIPAPVVARAANKIVKFIHKNTNISSANSSWMVTALDWEIQQLVSLATKNCPDSSAVVNNLIWVQKKLRGSLQKKDLVVDPDRVVREFGLTATISGRGSDYFLAWTISRLQKEICQSDSQKSRAEMFGLSPRPSKS